MGLDRELQFALGGLLSGLCTVLAPWARNLVVFSLFMAVQGAAMGYIDAGSQTYCLDTWQGSQKKSPVLVGLHSLWSLGSTGAPLLITFFLTPLQLPENQLLEQRNGFNATDIAVNGAGNNHSALTTSTSQYDIGGNATIVNTLDVDVYHSIGNISRTDNVHVDYGLVIYAYVAVGICIMMTSLGFVLLYMYLLKVTRNSTCVVINHLPLKKENKRTRPSGKRTFRIILISVLFSFFLFFQWVEDIPSLLIATFVTSGLGWSVVHGSWITSLFWLAQGTGSLVGIAVSSVLSASSMILINLALGFTGWCLLMPHGLVPSWTVWLSLALGGLCVSTTYASTLLWCSQHMRVSGMASGLFLIGSSLGGMIGPPLAGNLMETYTHMALVYVCLAAVILIVIIFISLLCFTRMYKGKAKHVDVNTALQSDAQV